MRVMEENNKFRCAIRVFHNQSLIDISSFTQKFQFFSKSSNHYYVVRFENFHFLGFFVESSKYFPKVNEWKTFF